MRNKVEIEAFYPHPPERVWKALTEAKALNIWLMPGEFEPLIGFRYRFVRADGAAIKGKVTDVEESRLLAYTWEEDDGDGQPSLVIWTLAPQDGGTRVRIRQEAFDTPQVTCLAVDNYFNWAYALKHSLPGLLMLLRGIESDRPRSPMVYVEEEVLV